MTATTVADLEIVIPTVGRPSLADLLQDLVESFAACGTSPRRVIVVDDRACVSAPDAASATASTIRDLLPAGPSTSITVLRSGSGGPARARNVGWRAAEAAWVAFVDDDVRVPTKWFSALLRDIDACQPHVAATQGNVTVPLDGATRPTDWQRNVGGLAGARYITADLAIRRAVLRSCDGFDERFRSAYREDAELALRVLQSGHAITWGSRRVEHPVRPAPWWISVAKQSGNADDALMRALHGRQWRAAVESPAGARSRHVSVALLTLGALVARVAGQRRLSVLAALASMTMVVRFGWQRIAPGPRSAREIAAMAVTSVAIPFAATAHAVRGWVRWRGAEPKPVPLAPTRSGTTVTSRATTVEAR